MAEQLPQPTDKQQVVDRVGQLIDCQGFKIADTDFSKPWGAFYRLENSEAEKFIDAYFADIKEKFATFENLSPKYLMVAPGLSLSWQYHSRRAEIWRVVEGPVCIKLSNDDIQPTEANLYNKDDLVCFDVGKRHRLIGADGWGIIAEIWQHIDPKNPSDENDIVRLQDDFGR